MSVTPAMHSRIAKKVALRAGSVSAPAQGIPRLAAAGGCEC